MFLYVKYFISLNRLEELIGGITDGNNTHCIKFTVSKDKKFKMGMCGHMKELNILQVLNKLAVAILFKRAENAPLKGVYCWISLIPMS